MMGNRHYKVLVIDDRVVIVELLKKMLQNEYEVLTATSGAEGLQIVAQQHPDLVLLDIVMPEMDGFEVCQRLKSDPATEQIPVIFLTVLDTPEQEAQGLVYGAADYICKPISEAIVQLRVRNHLKLRYQMEMLESISMTDSLTGLANRRAFDLFLTREIHTAARRKESLSLIMLDIDFFKNYNDSYGHVSGDECLMQIGRALSRSAKRTVDVVARYGGEEFALILPDTGMEGAKVVAEQVLKAIEGLNIPHQDTPIGDVVTVSLGCATVVGDESINALEMVKQADKMLYQSKEGGRNRASFCSCTMDKK